MRKTYQELKEARFMKNCVPRALLDDCEFRDADFFRFRTENTAQTGTLVLSRTDPEARYLVLRFWPDVAGDPTLSRLRAICPPGREAEAKAVCEAVRVYTTNAVIAARAARRDAQEGGSR